MTESGTLGQENFRGKQKLASIRVATCRMLILAAFGLFVSRPVWAQSDDAPVSLGDLARSIRKKKEQATQPGQNPAPPATPARTTVIDNDNLTQVVEEAESRHLVNTSMTYSFEGQAKMFQISSPDVTCSLSFNGRMSSLLARPASPVEMPAEELKKLQGPATINEASLEISVFNGSSWRVEEITVGVTIVRKATVAASGRGIARLVPAASETRVTSEKSADTTTLYHLKAESIPSSTTTFKSPLSSALDPDEEWHWAIVQAKGIPPRPEDSALSQPLIPSNNAVIP
jgi:hypothetical protein